MSTMARGLRFIQPGAIHHLISRFVGQEFFISGDEERVRYLACLERHISRSDWRCFAFAVMSNHIHLGVLAGEDPLASWMRDMHSEFADWINERRKRIGAVFVRGPTAIEIADERVTRLIAYIHRNPVRAGLVAHPRDSTWTSHRAYIGLAPQPEWLDVKLGLTRAQKTPEELDAIAESTIYDTKQAARRGRRRAGSS